MDESKWEVERERNKTTGKNIYVKNFEKECGARLERRAKQRRLSKEKKSIISRCIKLSTRWTRFMFFLF